MDLEVTCPRCQKEYNDTNVPRLFTACGHTYCEKCMGQMSVAQDEGKIKITCPECPQGTSFVLLDRISLLPKNLALLNFLQMRKNNTSTRSINSLKDQSFNVPKINRSYQDEDEDEALMTAINGKETHSQQQQGQRKKERVLTTPALTHKPSQSENQLCLLHNKQIELVCLVDHQRLCSKCALFGQHRGHEFVSLDQVQQGNKKIYETLLQIFDEKANVLDQLTSKKRREMLIGTLNDKTNSLKKEISDKFKRIQDEIIKTERAIYHKLQQMAENIERKMKKLLVIDQKTIDIYQSWAINAQKKFNSYQSGTHEGLLQFYLSGKGLIQSGKDIIAQLKHQEQKSNDEANKYVEEIGIFFNDGPCLSSLPKVVELYENEKDLDKKMTNAFSQKENSRLFANVEFSYEDIKQKLKTDAHEDDESLLELVDEFQHNHSAITSKILDESMIKLEKATPTKQPRPSTNGTPSSKVIPKKRPTLTHKEIPKEQKAKQQKKEAIPRQAIKKKMRAIKIPQKYEKMMEGVLTDTVDTVDFTNAEFGDAVALQICDMLKANTKNRNLKLIRNKITDEGFTKILPLLAGFTTINFSQNLLTQNCLNVLSELRPSLPNLKTVILSQNKIAQRKCKPVVEKLRKMDLAISI